MNVAAHKNKELRNAKEVLETLKEQLNLTTDKEIADLLGVKPNTLSAWKQRETLDYKLVINFAFEKKINLDTLFIESSISQEEIAPSYLIPSNYIHQYTIGAIKNLNVFPGFMIGTTNKASRIFQVISNNMEPTIKQNEFVLCEAISPEEVKEGNIIIIVSKKKGFLINRVTELRGSIISLENENHDSVMSKRVFDFNLSEVDELWVVDVVSQIINESKNWRGSSLL